LNVSARFEESEFVTASEVANYVFCKHAWYLGRQGTSVSHEAEARLSAGTDWQDQKDGAIPIAIERQTRAKQATTLAWTAGLIVIAAMILWEGYLLLHR